MSNNPVTNKSSRRNWWWYNRLRYNKGLFAAGFIAFLLYCILGPMIIEPHEEFEETVVEMVFQGTGYLIMMALANILYTLGWVIDVAFNSSSNQKFREQLFRVGYWFSFILPILVILSVMARFLFYGH